MFIHIYLSIYLSIIIYIYIYTYTGCHASVRGLSSLSTAVTFYQRLGFKSYAGVKAYGVRTPICLYAYISEYLNTCTHITTYRYTYIPMYPYTYICWTGPVPPDAKMTIKHSTPSMYPSRKRLQTRAGCRGRLIHHLYEDFTILSPTILSKQH